MRLTLPWPPSANSYWRNIVIGGKPRTLLSRAARAYQVKIAAILREYVPAGWCLKGRLSVDIRLFPPDKRKRDIDNPVKPLLDSLEAAGVYLNDSQIDEILVTREKIEKGGRVVVGVEER